MARVPEAELERIKAEVSLERLAEAKGVELKRHGADLLGRCPFHDDREPSLVISPSKGLWHCLGACQAGGSVIDWVMRAEGITFRHAVELLRTDPSFAASAAPVGVRHSTVKRLPSPVALGAGDQAALQQVVAYYHSTLLEAPEARAYLASRGLDDRELIDTFSLGFANRTLGLRLPDKNRKAGADVRGRLQRLGVIRETGHEHFNGSIVVPITDGQAGESIVEMYGRKITRNLLPRSPLHMYLPGPHRGVWNAAGLGGADHVILCEALLDALTFWVHGMRNVTAAYGIEGFTDEHLAVLASCGAERVYIAYDRDAAGDRAAVQLAPKLVAAGLAVYRMQFPQGMDANSYACSEPSTAAERLAEVVRRAVWLGNGAVQTVSPAPIHTADAPDEVPAEHNNTTAGEAKTEAAKEETATTPPLLAATPAPAPAETLPPPPPATPSPLPRAAMTPHPRTPEVIADVSDDELTLTMGGEGGRTWRVRGLAKLTPADGALRVNLLLRIADEGGDGGRFHVDTLDLYVAKQRAAFTKEAASETGVLEETVRRDVGRVLLSVEEVLAERQRQEAAHEQEPSGAAALSSEDREAAFDLLRAPDLLDRITAAYDRIGIAGEATNALVAYLAATSRLLERPLAVVMQSSSAAGKSSLLEATLALLPESARVKYSAMTGQSLYYMAERELAHKVLAVVEEEGAERAAYALKLLQSEGELSIASTGKDPQTGRLVTQDYNVKGPVALFLTTTAIDVDEELLNRCLVLTVDEEREQTEAIHRRQREREMLSGLVREAERQATIRLHRAAQTLLRPLHVVNPYATQLTFASARTRTRRDHQKYLTLIRTIALLHQYQRDTKRATTASGDIEYIEVIPADIALANRLAHEVLGRSLDELPPQTRRLLQLLDELVSQRMGERGFSHREEVRFTRREIRDATGWGATQVGIHLDRLVRLEYVTTYLGGRGRMAVYELAWSGDGSDGAPTLDGLIDPDTLVYDVELTGPEASLPGPIMELPGSKRPQNGGLTAGYRGAENGPNSNLHKGFPALVAQNSENAHTGSFSETDDTDPVVPVQAAVN